MGTMVGLASGLSRKLKKVIDFKTESPDLFTSLDTLSTFYSENTAQSRLNLRPTIDNRSLQINLDFPHASRSAQITLDRVEEEVDALAKCCDRFGRPMQTNSVPLVAKIAKALNSCSASTGDIISTTERLKQELEITNQWQEILSCFLHFLFREGTHRSGEVRDQDRELGEVPLHTL